MPQQLLNHLLKMALRKNTSDIHIHPLFSSFQVRFRIDGKLYKMQNIDFLIGTKLIAHLKFQSGMDIGEKRKPQSGQIELSVNQEKIALRLSALPHKLGSESIVVRIFRYQKPIPFLKSSIFKQQPSFIHSLCKDQTGLFLFTGTTGSGKSSSMYSLADLLCQDTSFHVITIEDPVEHFSDSFLQIEINEQAKLGYEQILRASLRHDPDIIIIGEIRDPKTAQIAVRAALTGHLVLSTLHAGSIYNVIPRLLELSLIPRELFQALLGFSYQDFYPLFCSLCKGYCHPHCTHLSLKRSLLYDVISTKEEIKHLFEEDGAVSSSLFSLYMKGVCYGFL